MMKAKFVGPLALILNTVLIVIPSWSQVVEPNACRFAKNGIFVQKSCNRLIGVGTAVRLGYGNACVFRHNQWYIGRLVRDLKVTTTFKYRFVPETLCTYGVTATDRDPAAKSSAGPSILQISNSVERLMTKKSGKDYRLFQSKLSIGAGSVMALGNFKPATEVALNCAVAKGERMPCQNTSANSSPNSNGFCAPVTISSEKKIDGKYYTGSWWAIYSDYPTTYKLCRYGINKASAATLVQNNGKPLKVIKDIDRVSVSDFLSSYDILGNGSNKGMINWWQDLKASGNEVDFDEMTACYVNSTRYDCRNNMLDIRDTALPEKTIKKACYAFKPTETSWRIVYVKASGVKTTCTHVEATKMDMVEP